MPNTFTRFSTAFSRSTALLMMLLLPLVGWGQVSLPTNSTAVTQDFIALAAPTTVTSSTMPAGWVFVESASNANTTYTVSDGNATTGDTYSFGGTSAATKADRALGSIASGSLGTVYGASFTNNTGVAITQLAVSYTGEQWRLGVANASRNDQITFAYSTTASSITGTGYTDVPSLAFTTPSTTGAAGSRDGNATGFRTAISSTITGLNIAPGATFYLKWTDVDIAGTDDGLAIDDVSITPNPPTITTVTPNTAVAGGAAVPITVVGTNFISGAAIYYNGTALTTAFVSATQLTATIPAASIATAGTFPVTVRNTTTSAASNAVTFTVTAGTPAPTLVATQNNYTGLTTTTNVPSSPPLSYVLTGSNLTSDVTIIPDNGLEVSFSSGSGYVGSAGTLTALAADVQAAGGKTVYFRLAAVASAATYTNALILNGAGAGTSAVNANVTVSGIVTAPPANTLSTGTISPTSYCVGSTGASVSVPFTATGTFSGNTYTAYLGSGTSTPIGTLVSDANTGTIAATLPATLATGTTYRIHVEASSPATVAADNGANLTVRNYATNNVTAFTATAGNAQATLAWTNPTACASRIVVVASTGTISAVPTGTFTADAAFGSGTDLGSGSGQFVVYDGPGTGFTVTGLINGTAYNFKAFVTNGDGYSTGTTATATPAVPAPVISGFSPTNGPIGTLVTISGTNLAGITGVTIGGTAATGVAATAATVTATVAAGTTTGAVVLSNGTTTYTAPGTFTVTAALGTPTVASTTICPGVPFDVTFTATGPYTTSSTFTVQRSSAAGSFSTPIAIGTGTYTATPTQTVSATLAANLTPGTGYLIRVVSASPTATSPTLAITANGVSITTGTQNIMTNANGSPLTATEVGPATSRQWAYGTVSSGPYNNDIIGETGTTYTPNFATAGTYYVVVKSMFACGILPSNAVTINVTAPVQTLTSNKSSLSGFTTSSGLASSEQSYILTAANLTVPVTVTAPTGYEVSLTSGTGFVAQVSAAASGTTTIYVRIAASAVAGPAAGTITNVSGTKSVDVDVDGTVYPTGTSACINEGFNGIGTNAAAAIAPTGWTFTGVTSYQSLPTSGAAIPAVKFDDNNDRVITAAVANPVQLSFTLFGNGTTGTSTMLVEGLDGTTYKPIATIALQLVKANGNYTYTSAPGAVFSNFTRFRFTYNKTTGNATFDDVLVLCGQSAPEIDITQNGTSAASGSTVTIGNATVGNAAPDATLLINNIGVANLTVSAVALSNNASGAFTLVTTPTLPATVAAGANTPVVVRYTPTAIGAQTATLTITNTDSDEGTYTITLAGAGLAPEPIAPQPTAMVANITPTTVDVMLAGGTGAKRLVVIRPTAVAAIAPTDGTTYTANLAYGSAAATNRTGLNNFVIIASATTGPVTVTGLTATSNYTVDVYAYNDGNVAGAENYLTTAPGTVAFTTLAPPVGAAQAGVLLLEEDMNYANGDLLTAHGWVAHSPNSGPISIVTGNISAAEYPVGTAGTASNRANSAGQEDINRAFTTPAGSNTIYLSAVVNITTDYDGYFLHLMDNTQTGANSVFRGKLFTQSLGNGTSTGAFRFGLSVVGTSSTLATAYTTGTYNLNQPYTVVVKYVTNPGGNDEASLFVLDAATPMLEPTPTVGPITEPNLIAAGSLNAVALRQDPTTPYFDIDGIRVATGWGSATGKPTFTGAAATLNPGNYYNVTVNNASTVTSTGAVNIENNLNLTSGNVVTTATNSLTLYQAATTSGGSATSFVSGPLARITGTGAATTFFPIGKGAAYRPLTLTSTAQTSTTTYTGEIQNASARTTSFDAPLTRVSNIRYATLTPDVQPTGFSGTLTMAFGIDDFVTDPQDNTLVMAKRNGAANWQSIGRTSATGTANAGQRVSGDLTSGVFNSFSDFALASTDPGTNNQLTTNPLPVALTSFSAQRQADKEVAVKWATASEKNSNYFDVQRSLDGREFATVATVTARGNSSQPTAYTALDKAALAAQLYYRLRQVDLDGTVAYSPVVLVTGAARATVLLYPNPATAEIHVVTPTATPYRVLNLLGQPVLSGSTTESTTLNVRTLPAGAYLLELQTTQGRQVSKFTKE